MLPFPRLPEGTNTLPQVDHVLVLMMENHSYDNYLGMLGRGRRQQPRGDGFTLGRDGRPTAANPMPDGRIQHAFRMPTTCQLRGKPTQEWKQAHKQFNRRRNDGFVKSASGPVAMGYWTGEDLPWAYSLASAFPLGDRWFAPVLGADPAQPPLPAGGHLGGHGR
jgi:phospholipase C